MNYTRKLKFMLYSIFTKWKMIIALAVLLALAFGGIAGVKEASRVKNYESNKKELLNSISQTEDKIIYYQEELAKLDAEIEQTKILIKDTDVVQTSEALININVFAEEGYVEQKLEEIKYIYFAVINNMSLYIQILDEMELNIAPFTLKRLVNQSYNSSSLLLSVKGFNQAINEQIRDKIIQEILKTEKSLNTSIQVHKIDLISKTSTQIKKPIYADVFNELNMERDSLVQSLDTNKRLIANYQQDIQNAKNLNIKSILTYVLMGFIFGIASALLITAIRVIFDNTVYSGDDITMNFPLPLLGEIPVGQPKKSLAGNRFLNRMFGYTQPVFPTIRSDSLKRTVENTGAQKLLLIVEGKAAKETVCKSMQFSSFVQVDAFTDTPQQELLVKEANEVTGNDVDRVSDIALVITYKKSRFRQIEQKLTAIESLNKNVLGFIGISMQDGE